ncbi:MAG TPA: CvpA family protein [Pseudogracilibacillus sp.]|nr:CvpA family protein [Pseudogracilibacillus sp.]
MISLLLIVLLLFGFLRGLKRGFILQTFHLVGFIVAFIVARLYYKGLADKLDAWIPYPELSSDASWAMFVNNPSVESAFYNVVAFAIIFFAVKIILQIIASMLDFVSRIPVLKQLNKLLGSILGFVEVYLVIFILLYIVALTPIDAIQERLANSSVATFMVESTPFLSKMAESMWFAGLSNIIS